MPHNKRKRIKTARAKSSFSNLGKIHRKDMTRREKEFQRTREELDRLKNKEDSDFYIERGVRVKKGSKLDKAIMSFKKKGFYCTKPYSEEMQNCPSALSPLRPSALGGPIYGRVYRHPLVSGDKTLREERWGG